MSKRYNNGSHYENHQRAAEMHELAAHTDRAAAEHHGKEDHETGEEHSRQALEHSEKAFKHSQQVAGPQQTFGHDEIAALAYELWTARGQPEGTSEQDWHEAVAQLRARYLAPKLAHHAQGAD